MRWETEQASRAARSAARNWRRHRKTCSECFGLSSYAGKVLHSCAEGAELEAAAVTAAAALEACVKLDAMPARDQEKLF